LIEQLPLKIREEVDKVASAKKLNKNQKEKLEVEILKAYNDSRFEPGDVIGIIAAQSISEPATQMTMRTYHFAGTAGIRVTYGLPRLIEIFDAKKELETPMMTIFLKSAHNSAEGARKFA
jgi:DNA-directed RNA polymerase subunit A"